MHDYHSIRRVLVITMLLNWLATAVTLVIGYRTGTLSLTANGLDAFFDGFSNVAGLAAISVASQPPDREHPYGHRKFETIIALGIAILLAITTWELVQGALRRLQQPFTPTVTIWSFLVLIVSITAQGSAAIYELRAGRTLQSELLVADARHSFASTMVSVVVLIGLPFVSMGLEWVDPALTLLISVFIAKLGLDIIRDSVPVLLDRAPLDPDQIGRVVESVDGVTSYHRIRSRGSADDATVDLHVRVGPNLPMARADAIADEVRDRLKAQVSGVTDVTVHVEPQPLGQASTSQIYAAILRAAAAHPVAVHEVWGYRDPDDRIRAEAHIGVPPTMTVGQADELVSGMEQEVLAQVPWVSTFHTHIEPAFRDLMPGRPVPPDEAEPIESAVREAVASVPGLSEPGNLFVHCTPEGQFLSLDCAARPDLTVSASHAMAHEAALAIRKRLPEVVDVAVRVRPA